MRDNNEGMVKIYGGEKVHDRYYGLVSITVGNKELKLKFGTDHQGYLALVRALQFRPFDNKMNQPYRHYFVGGYNKKTGMMTIRVEQGQTTKQFETQCLSFLLIQNLKWLQTIQDREEVKHLLDVSDDEMFENIKKFVSEKTGVQLSELTRRTRVESDLGMGGLDTISFFDEFFFRFNVDLPKGFHFENYVQSEIIRPFSFIKRLFSKQKQSEQKVIDLTLGDLERIALTGIWIEPETTPPNKMA